MDCGALKRPTERAKSRITGRETSAKFCFCRRHGPKTQNGGPKTAASKTNVMAISFRRR
jgi:hypothetical protein